MCVCKTNMSLLAKVSAAVFNIGNDARLWSYGRMLGTRPKEVRNTKPLAEVIQSLNENVWGWWGLTCWDVGQVVQVLMHQVTRQKRRSPCYPVQQRGFAPNESSLDQRAGVFEEDWASLGPVWRHFRVVTKDCHQRALTDKLFHFMFAFCSFRHQASQSQQHVMRKSYHVV